MVWVVWGTSEKYQDLFSGFAKSDKTLSKTTINIRVFPDYNQYKQTLLSTLADGNGPDIFMVNAWGDDILSEKVEPLPSSVVNLTDFDKRYEDIFLPLLSSTWSKNTLQTYLQWVPLGYETLWIFYNKSLIRSVPKTWSELDLLYTDGTAPWVFPSNLGLSSRYTPSSVDILSLFLVQGWAKGYDDNKITDGWSKYLSYAETPIISDQTPTDPNTIDTSTTGSWNTLWDMKWYMDDQKLTTLDLFMRWKIAFVIWFPSMIEDIEKAQKRAGENAVSWLILTAQVPQISLGEKSINIARYNYLGLSKNTKNPILGAKLLWYLMSDEALTKSSIDFPLLISPIKSISDTQGNTSLSTVFARVKMDAFIPEIWTNIELFHFGLKYEYEKLFTDTIDRWWKIDINNLIQSIGKSIQCQIESTRGDILPSACANNSQS